MSCLAIIHTTSATIELLKGLAAEVLPDVKVVNFMDDSVLPQLAANGGRVEAVAPRFVQYARFAQEVGADVILSACSSVGELAAQAQAAVRVPVVRIDQAMAEEAVRRARVIGVAATLATTLEPTRRLLQATAEAAARVVSIRPLLVQEAYQRLMAGDRDGHDHALAEGLRSLAETVDVLVLAQASMARVLPALTDAQREKVLTSPGLAMAAVRDALTTAQTHAARR
jgi:aspartate/glutamate racemase